jgi:hypothetical protein
VGYDKAQSYANPGFRAMAGSPFLGSKTEVAALRRDVCFAPVSGHRQAVSACPKSADCVEKLENRGAPKISQM